MWTAMDSFSTAAQTYNALLTHAVRSQYKPYFPQPSFLSPLPQKCKEQKVQVQQAEFLCKAMELCNAKQCVGCDPRASAQEDVATSL